MPELGTLMSLAPSDHWKDEAGDFTPWVANGVGLKLVSDALSLELDPESAQTEVPIGSFRADIACMTTDGKSLVMIENQLTVSDHDHAGKVLTYSAFLDAATVVWIATKFRDEHSDAIKWLNKITDDRYRFFGLEIELLRIDECRPAPRLNVVVQPDGWPRSRPPDGLSPSQHENLEFWTAFVELTKDNDTGLKPHKPPTYHYMNFGIGTARVSLSAVRLRRDGAVRVELYLTGETQRGFYEALRIEREAIECELQSKLEWLENPRTSSIRIEADADPSNRSDWPRQFEWLTNNVKAFDKAFRHRINSVKTSLVPTT